MELIGHQVVIIDGKRYLINDFDTDDECYVDTFVQKMIEQVPNAVVDFDEARPEDYRTF